MMVCDKTPFSRARQLAIYFHHEETRIRHTSYTDQIDLLQALHVSLSAFMLNIGWVRVKAEHLLEKYPN